METAKADAGFEGTLEEFISFLRTDPQFVADTADELMGVAAYVNKRVDDKIDDYFGFLSDVASERLTDTLAIGIGLQNAPEGLAVAIALNRLTSDSELTVAAAAGMSESSLHAHFKSITRMTPIEFQKQLRLQEARRLMTSSGSSASEAGFAVGYDSPSQFSREYRRLFGLAPRQDVDRLRAEDRYVGAV